MQIERKTLPFEIKATSDNGGGFEGYCNAFHTIDDYGEIVVPGSFMEAIPKFLDDGFVGGINHAWDCPIGKPLEAKEDSVGLYVKAKLSQTEHAQECRILMQDGVIKKMSIGYRVKADEWLDDAEAVAKYWEEWGYKPTPQDISRAQYGARLLRKINPLFEFSPVSVPANEGAGITRVKRYAPGEIKTEREFEKSLREVYGFSRNDAETICRRGYKALFQREAEEETPIENEPTPEAEAQTEQDAPEVKTEETPPVETPAPIEVEYASQEEVRSLYASILTRQAKLLAPR